MLSPLWSVEEGSTDVQRDVAVKARLLAVAYDHGSNMQRSLVVGRRFETLLEEFGRRTGALEPMSIASDIEVLISRRRRLP